MQTIHLQSNLKLKNNSTYVPSNLLMRMNKFLLVQAYLTLSFKAESALLEYHFQNSFQDKFTSAAYKIVA